MYLTALHALDRKTGKLVTLAAGGAPHQGDAEVGKVSQLYQRLISGTPEGAEMRTKYSHALFIVDNNVRNSHAFPDLKAQEDTARKTKQLNDAVYELDVAKDRVNRTLQQLEAQKLELERAKSGVVGAGATVDPASLPKLVTSSDLEVLQAKLDEANGRLAQIAADQAAAEKAVQEKNAADNAALAKAADASTAGTGTQS